MTNDRRILAVDYGERRIGVALSDPTGCVAQGLPTIVYRGRQEAVQRVCQLIKQHSVKTVVVGLPLTMKGRKAHTVAEVERFIQELVAKLEVPVVTWDERLTTVAARRALTNMGKSPSRHKERTNQISAVLLLQSYLDKISR